MRKFKLSPEIRIFIAVFLATLCVFNVIFMFYDVNEYEFIVNSAIAISLVILIFDAISNIIDEMKKPTEDD